MALPALKFQRRTMLTDARRSAIINKMALFYQELAAEMDIDKVTMDVALYRMATIAAQVQSGVDGPLPFPSEDVATLRTKARQWLTEINPDWVDQWERTIDRLNDTWLDPATSPTPLGEDADPN